MYFAKKVYADENGVWGKPPPQKPGSFENFGIKRCKPYFDYDCALRFVALCGQRNTPSPQKRKPPHFWQ